ncbi:hypothetical protein [Pseudomonas cavernicola]|nr:hypothetical protein [Pseudomonas cavernicola]
MTKEKFAAMLTGREYREEIPPKSASRPRRLVWWLFMVPAMT